VRVPGAAEVSIDRGRAIGPDRDKVEIQGGSVDVGRFAKVEPVAAEVKTFSNVEQLVARGVSRLTAERIVAIERGDAEPGRARPHSQARH
jgi:hypothetical protein